jgi:hypothetical protein
MPSTANISVRQYIYYLPHPFPQDAPVPYTLGLPGTNPLKLNPVASEPTMTLVLTSSSGTFVDLRILRPMHAAEPMMPNAGGDLHRLDWGFAGLSTSHAIEDKTGNGDSSASTVMPSANGWPTGAASTQDVRSQPSSSPVQSTTEHPDYSQSILLGYHVRSSY